MERRAEAAALHEDGSLRDKAHIAAGSVRAGQYDKVDVPLGASTRVVPRELSLASLIEMQGFYYFLKRNADHVSFRAAGWCS